MNKLSTGNAVIDHLLEGGFETDIITTIYGPAGSGKTTFCLFAAVEVAKAGKKVVFVDTEGGFSVERLKQITPDYEKILEKFLFLKPMKFDEQRKDFDKLKSLVNDEIGMVVVDSIAFLYRLELGQKEEVYEINRDLGRQISWLCEIARKNNIPVLITNQIYANFDDKTRVNLVGGDLLKYGSKCLIELQITPDRKRRAVLRKHRSLPEEKEVVFEITNSCLVAATASKGFKLF